MVPNMDGEGVPSHDGEEDGVFTPARTDEGVMVPVAVGEDRDTFVAGVIPEPEEDGDTFVAGVIPAVKEDPVAEGGKSPTLEADEEDPIAEGIKSLTLEAAAEVAEKFFKCPVCKCILHEPAVIACGHMICVGCVRTVMDIVGTSKCPLCRKSYNHLPRSCQLISNLILKLQPFDAKIEETQVEGICSLADLLAEFDKTMEPTYAHQISVKVEDVSCALCHELLYQPTILNCGHVFCLSCMPPGEKTECPTCGKLHPSGPLAVCSYLDNFVGDFFPTAYKSRVEKAKPFSGNTWTEIMNSNTKLSHTHVGVGCDFCGVYPIKGDRFSCKTCIDFDLCGKCAKTDLPLEGYSGQQHLPDHVMELNNSFLLTTVLRVLEDDQDHNEQGTWEFQPEQWVSQGGLMHWQEGQQAPQDDSDESDDSASEDAG